MNRTQKFALNSITAAMLQIVAMLAGFITPRAMISTYGSEMNGLVSSINQLISYVSLVEAGIGGAAIFSLYKPLANKDYLGVSRIVKAARKSYFQAGYMFSSGVFILSIIYAFLANTGTITFPTIFFLVILLGANGCVSFFILSGYKVLLTADQKNYVLSLKTIVQTILRTIIICTLAHFKTNIILLYIIALVPLLLTTFVLLYYCKRNYSYIQSNVDVDKASLNQRWDVIYQQILGTIQTGAPTVISTILLNLKLVSVYSVYNMVVNGINGVLGIFISGLPAGFGELIAMGEKKKLQKTTSEFEVGYYFILSIVYSVTIAMILPFVSIYAKGFTDVNYYRPLLAFVITINGLLYNIKTPQSMLIISAGMYRETRTRVTIQGIIIIVFGFLFGKLYGLNGILLASCFSNLYRVVDLVFFVPKNITGAKKRVTVFRMLRVVIIVAIVWVTSVFLDFKMNTYVDWIFMSIIYVVYATIIACIFTFTFDKCEFLSLIKRINVTILRRNKI